MNEIKDGGPAFPNATISGKISMTESGMSLRDYFAAKAMQGLIAIIHSSHASAGSNEGMSAISDTAYGIADVMLKAREVKA